MALVPKYDRLLDDLREDDLQGFITMGANGVTSIRWQDSGGGLWDITLDTTGHWVKTPVSSVTMVGPWLSLGLTNIEHS